MNMIFLLCFINLLIFLLKSVIKDLLLKDL